MNKNAIKAIIFAQIASDGGKRFYSQELFDVLPKDMVNKAYDVCRKGYNVKDHYILQACQIISRHPSKDTHFFVTKDEEGIAKFIIYFDIKVDGKRMQVSFHSFSDWAKFEKSSVFSRGHWDHKDSTATCIKLAKYL